MACAAYDCRPVGSTELLRVASSLSILRVATTTARLPVELIKLTGAMMPVLGLNCIVDIVDAGNTLRANGLEAMDVICDIASSHR